MAVVGSGEVMAERAEDDFVIVNQLGLHARAAAQLVQLTNNCPCDVVLRSEDEEVNGKSIMGVLMLAAACGQVLHVACIGPGAEACLKEIGELIANKFGEGR
jgi:phosphocarrier protein HPr